VSKLVKNSVTYLWTAPKLCAYSVVLSTVLLGL